MRTKTCFCFLIGGSFLLTSSAAGQERLKDEQQVVTKGLAWLAKAQQKDGHWEGGAGYYPTAMTAMGGMALLAEGSTPLEGKFKDELNRAVSWLTTHRRKNGLLCSTHESEDKRYMHSHGLALIFLANVSRSCAREKRDLPPDSLDGARQKLLQREQKVLRRELQAVLNDAVAFSVLAQNHRGGWFYFSAAEGGDSDEMHQTALQLHALEAARVAGVAVPAAVLDKARTYLDGSIPRNRTFDSKPLPNQPPAIAVALAAVTECGDIKSPLVKKWLPYCPKDASGLKSFMDLEPYFHSHYAQVMYRLGDKGHAQLFPESKESLTWSAYRKTLWTQAAKLQDKDGSWRQGLGPVYATSCYLIALQVENRRFPIWPKGAEQ
jgi:hypothetical protein